MSLQKDGPVHVGIDNQTTVTTFNHLATRAKHLKATDPNNNHINAQPYPKPLSILNDGDLWAAV